MAKTTKTLKQVKDIGKDAYSWITDPFKIRKTESTLSFGKDLAQAQMPANLTPPKTSGRSKTVAPENRPVTYVDPRPGVFTPVELTSTQAGTGDGKAKPFGSALANANITTPQINFGKKAPAPEASASQEMAQQAKDWFTAGGFSSRADKVDEMFAQGYTWDNVNNKYIEPGDAEKTGLFTTSTDEDGNLIYTDTGSGETYTHDGLVQAWMDEDLMLTSQQIEELEAKGVNFNFSKEQPVTAMGKLEQDLAKIDADIAEMERRNKFAQGTEAAQMADLGRETTAAKAGVTASMSQGREGVMSLDMPKIISQTNTIYQERYNRAQRQVEEAQRQRAWALEKAREAADAGKTELAKAYREQASLADMRVGESIVRTEEVALQNAREALSFVKDFQVIRDTNLAGVTANMEAGQVYTIPQLQNLSQMYDVPLNDVMTLYSSMESVRIDTKLSQEEKAIAIADAKRQFDLAVKYQDDKNLQASMTIAQMRREGRSEEEISSYMQMVGVNPMYDIKNQLELEASLLANEIERKVLNNEPVGYAEYEKMLEYEREMADLNLIEPGSVFLPLQPLDNLIVEQIGGQLVVDREGGFRRYQCGEFVNRLWGLPAGGADGFANSIEDKKALMERNGVSINSVNLENYQDILRPGMAILREGGTTGHVQFITAVSSDGNLKIIEANAPDGTGSQTPNFGEGTLPTEKIVNINDIGTLGFVYPPDGKYEVVGGKNDVKSLTMGLQLELPGTGKERDRAIASAEKYILRNQGTGRTDKQLLADWKKTNGILTDSDKARQKESADLISAQLKAYNETKDKASGTKATLEAIKNGEFVNGEAVAEISLIFDYMKALDPSSVVRESEFATFEQARSFIDSAGVWVNRLKEGDVLSDEQVKALEIMNDLRTKTLERNLYTQIAREKYFSEQEGVPFTAATDAKISQLRASLSDEDVKFIKDYIALEYKYPDSHTDIAKGMLELGYKAKDLGLTRGQEDRIMEDFRSSNYSSQDKELESFGFI